MLDYALPDADGLELVERLAMQGNGSSPAVMLMIGSDDENIASRAMRIGVGDYLASGDLTPKLLQSIVRRAIENVKLRQQLQQSEDRWRLSLDAVRECVGILTIDRDWRLVYLNPAWAEILGFTTAELLARPYIDFIHPDDRASTLAAAQELTAGEVVFKFENRYLCKDGSYRWLSWSCTPYLEQNLVYSIAHDVTEERRSQAALLASERKFRAIFNQTFGLIALLDVNGIVLEVNQTALESLAEPLPGGIAVRREDITGKPFWETPWWYTPQLQQQLKQAIDCASHGELICFEMQFPAPSGVMVSADFSLKPICDEAGRVMMLVAEAHDITDLKRAEGDLREAQERLQTGIQVAGVGLARFDYTTNLVALSPEAAMLYGFAADTSVVTRDRIRETFHPDDRAKLQVKIAELLDPAGTGWFAEDRQVVWPNGEVRYLSVRKQIFFVGGASPLENRSSEVARPSYTILAAVDITERKQIQAALEARNQELDSFVYIVSHDLKAPLRAIANLSQWIEEDLAGSLPAANQAQMQLLRDRVYRMEATIEGLLDYARIGRTAGTIESVAVAQLIIETIDSLAPPPTFQIAIAQHLPTIHTNRLLLSQVFANPIGNAIKHHDRVDGSLHLGIAERGDFYEFAIADDGPGIPPEQHERVFGIFQAVNPQKRPDSTGIGLAIVKKIIEAEGGTIRLESNLGQGTTFYFTWPKGAIVPSAPRSS